MKQRRLTPRQAKQHGFTLLEVLVALAIVALTLITGLKAGAAWTLTAERQWQLTLAQLCVDNELIRLRLSTQMPGVGESTANCPQAERALQVVLTVRPTPNPSFRRVDAQVFDTSVPLLRVTTLVGRY